MSTNVGKACFKDEYALVSKAGDLRRCNPQIEENAFCRSRRFKFLNSCQDTDHLSSPSALQQCTNHSLLCSAQIIPSSGQHALPITSLWCHFLSHTFRIITGLKPIPSFHHSSYEHKLSARSGIGLYLSLRFRKIRNKCTRKPSSNNRDTMRKVYKMTFFLEI
jgi:hypothetical protein